jgi:hypothetical protein
MLGFIDCYITRNATSALALATEMLSGMSHIWNAIQCMPFHTMYGSMHAPQNRHPWGQKSHLFLEALLLDGSMVRYGPQQGHAEARKSIFACFSTPFVSFLSRYPCVPMHLIGTHGFHVYPWTAMGAHVVRGFQRIPGWQWIPWARKEFLGCPWNDSMDAHGIQGYYTHVFHGCPWVLWAPMESMGAHGFHGHPWNSMGVHGMMPWVAMASLGSHGFHGCPLKGRG